MNDKKINKILEQVALMNGVSVETVRMEIEEAIAIGQCSSKPEVQKQWELMGLKGKVATPEEVIIGLSNWIKDNYK